jgi:DNA repair protein RecN (Recombination protein N)
MLRNLHIQNYALIEEINVSFPGSLTVITGETGAGKSILLGALGLILGDRADSSVLNDKQRKCIIEGTFFIKPYKLRSFFTENELDYSDETQLRREVTGEGKSRAFINDTPVTLNLLKQLGEKLVDVHSQHETLLLNETSFRFNVMDSFAGIVKEKDEYKLAYHSFKQKEKKLAELKAKEAQAKKDFDYYQFQFKELEEAAIQPGELAKLESESQTLENAEFIKGNLAKAAEGISGGEINLLMQLAAVRALLQQIAKYGTEFEAFYNRLQSVYIELKELADDVSFSEEKVIHEPARLEEVNTKLDKLNRLLKKHGLNSEDELIAVQQQIEKNLSEAGSVEEDILKLEKEIKKELNTVISLAEKISAARKKSIPEIEKNIREMLGKLSMPNAQFKIECSAAAAPGPDGIDELRFLFSANKGGNYKELHKVASGGELSRLMLCIKAMIARLTSLPAIIFDEIDTGVSGDVGAKIGQILEQMSKGMQVISITHLPQIASKGKHHLFVYKQDTKNKTISFIKELSEADRVVEIAKMLSAGNPGEAAISNAKELLKR